MNNEFYDRVDLVDLVGWLYAGCINMSAVIRSHGI